MLFYQILNSKSCFFFLIKWIIINYFGILSNMFAYHFFSVKEHYTGNKVRNAQVREDLPRARVEQELEAIRYQSYVQQQ